ncbi:uncharacterized protein LOC125202218 [Salvia hispanica]|uniref:uncharacterized protein LOC125202218 n=1 Tax=Salvia hispanica TaxID=49212 RepID=UPI0020093A2A|nr:uncharacterized protein LOC125202218 [Salvia hispanica]
MDRGNEERDGLAKTTMMTTLRLLALLSFISLLYSYFFSGLSSYNNIQFSTLVFSLFAHAMDRKYVFLICNAIVAFLVKSLSFSSSSSPGVSQTPPNLVQENVEYGAGEEETDTQEECIYRAVIEEDEAEDEGVDEEDEDEDEGVDEDKGGEGESRVEEVSTEELNHKFEEFIKKMKEEIRVEAKQHLIAV